MTKENSPQSDAVRPGDAELSRIIAERISIFGSGMSVRIDVQVNSGTVTLQGSVSSAFEVQLLSHLVQKVNGVKRLRLRLRIVEPLTQKQLERDQLAVLKYAGLRELTIAVVLLLAVATWAFYPTGRAHGVQPVEVTLRVAGQPATGAFVTLHPRAAELPNDVRPHGIVGADGQIEWTTFQRGDGLAAGEYIVTAVWHRTVQVDGDCQPGPNLLPATFCQPETSPLRLSVKTDRVEPAHLEIML